MLVNNFPQIDLKKSLIITFETVLPNGVIIYETSEIVIKLTSVIKDFVEL